MLYIYAVLLFSHPDAKSATIDLCYSPPWRAILVLASLSLPSLNSLNRGILNHQKADVKRETLGASAAKTATWEPHDSCPSTCSSSPTPPHPLGRPPVLQTRDSTPTRIYTLPLFCFSLRSSSSEKPAQPWAIRLALGTQRVPKSRGADCQHNSTGTSGFLQWMQRTANQSAELWR